MKGHIRPRGRKKWALKIYIGRDPLTGKKKDKWFTVDGTKREAQVKMSELIAQHKGDGLIDAGKLTVADYLRSWMANHAQTVSIRSAERYRTILDHHLIPNLGSTPLRKLSPVHLQEYYGKALAQGRVSPYTLAQEEPDAPEKVVTELSPNTVKYIHGVLRIALQAAVRMQLIKSNPCTLVRPPRTDPREMKTLSPAESMALIKAFEGTTLHIPILLAVMTGMRRGEILGLRWRNVDLEGGVLSVAEALGEINGKTFFKPPKTAKSRRTIALPAIAVEALRKHRAEQGKKSLSVGLRATFDKFDLVCPNPLGEPWPPGQLSTSFRKRTRTLGMKLRFHDLRHTHITHLLAAGVNPKVACERAGHSTVAFTLNVYSHVTPGLQEDAAIRIDAALRAHYEK